MSRRRLEKETKKLVESFYNYLKQEKGISGETASEHAHQIGFFALHYLIGYEEKSLLEVTGSDIEDYLGNWYIFNMLSPKEQFVVLFDAIWNETSGEKFLPPDSGGRPERVQEERENIASALSECEVEKKYLFVEWIKKFCWELGNAEDELTVVLMATAFVYSVLMRELSPRSRYSDFLILDIRRIETNI